MRCKFALRTAGRQHPHPSGKWQFENPMRQRRSTVASPRMTNRPRINADERRRLTAKTHHYRIPTLVTGLSGLAVAKPINPQILLQPTRTEQQQACHRVYQPTPNLERLDLGYYMSYHFASVDSESRSYTNTIDLFPPLAVTTARCVDAFQKKEKEPIASTFDHRIVVWLGGGTSDLNESKKWSAELIFKDDKGQQIARWVPNIQQEGDPRTWSRRFNTSDGWKGQNTYVFQLKNMPKALSTKLYLIKTIILVTYSPLGLCSFPIDSEPRIMNPNEWTIEPRPGECQKP